MNRNMLGTVLFKAKPIEKQGDNNTLSFASEENYWPGFIL